MPVGVNALASKIVLEPKFKQRQKGKTWLPTHLWHAKRAHMTTKWGYSIASHPNDKCYRPTHRQAENGRGIVFDTSYFATMLLRGDVQAVYILLLQLAQKSSTLFGFERAYEGPIFLIPSNFDCTSHYPHSSSKDVLGEALIYVDIDRSNPNATATIATAIIRVHPAIFKPTWSTLLPHVLALKSKHHSNLELQDCRYAIGSIDLFGPHCLHMLASSLEMIKRNEDYERSEIYTRVVKAGDPKLLPHGSVFPVEYFDPRTIPIKSHERRKRHSPTSLNSDDFELLDSHRLSLAAVASLSPLLTTTGRKVRVEHSKRAARRLKLNRERQDKTGVGAPAKDNVAIPAMLVRRANGAITLMLPWQWVKIFFKKLVIPGYTIFGGLEQYHQIMYERRLPFFPDDFPGTEAGLVAEREKAEEREHQWKARPRSKRFEYSSLKLRNGDGKGELGRPFSCDWSFLLCRLVGQTNVRPWMITDFKKFVKRQDNGNQQGELLSAIFQVGITLVARGRPSATARVYAIPEYDLHRWMRMKYDRKTQPSTADVCIFCPFYIFPYLTFENNIVPPLSA